MGVTSTNLILPLKDDRHVKLNSHKLGKVTIPYSNALYIFKNPVLGVCMCK